LIAQRGFGSIDGLLNSACTEPEVASGRRPVDFERLAMAPDAASAIVAALVERFHGPNRTRHSPAGPGWTLSDEPSRPDALSGGSFDDAGFQASKTVLAERGVLDGGLGGPGHYWRKSFRQPPMEGESNLVMPPGQPDDSLHGAPLARRCRVLKMTSELWVLELGFKPSAAVAAAGSSWMRVNPVALLEACRSQLGGLKVTAGGPIVPGLLFEGLPTVHRE
jgi:hypothetical protein